MKSRNFCLVLYPGEDVVHEECMRIIRAGDVPFAAAVHDKDMTAEGTLKKPHTHVVLSFENPRSPAGVAKLLGLPANYVQICHGLRGAMRYLIHADDPDKYQYASDIVEFNSAGKVLYEDAFSSAVRVDDAFAYRVICDFIDSCEGFISLRKLAEKAYDEGVSKFLMQRYSFFSALIKEHNLMYSEKENKRSKELEEHIKELEAHIKENLR